MKKKQRLSRIIFRKVLQFIISIIFFIRKTFIFKNSLLIDKTTPAIYAIFHDEMLPFIQYCKNKNFIFLTSSNHFGASVGNYLKTIGFGVINGSPSKGGSQALKDMQKVVEKKKQNIILTVDGSRGPRHKMKAGAVVLAQRCQVPLYLCRAVYKGKKINSSWDKFLYPYPFSKVTFKYKKIIVDKKLSREEISKLITISEQELKKL